jgi:hypothetical protein
MYCIACQRYMVILSHLHRMAYMPDTALQAGIRRKVRGSPRLAKPATGPLLEFGHTRQKLQELLVAVFGQARSDHLAGEYVQRGEQGCGAPSNQEVPKGRDLHMIS